MRHAECLQVRTFPNWYQTWQNAPRMRAILIKFFIMNLGAICVQTTPGLGRIPNIITLAHETLHFPTVPLCHPVVRAVVGTPWTRRAILNRLRVANCRPIGTTLLMTKRVVLPTVRNLIPTRIFQYFYSESRNCQWRVLSCKSDKKFYRVWVIWNRVHDFRWEERFLPVTIGRDLIPDSRSINPFVF